MRQIGFKNFRRFEDFPVIDINPITIFVGENNAGKSTVVKAMLSVLDFLNSSMFEELSSETFGSNEFWEKVSVLLKEKNFYFNKNYYAHIGTFSRAIYNKSKGNTITFSITIDNRMYTIVVEGNKKDTEAISGKVISVKVHNAEYNIDIAFDSRQ
jgi:AAA15 family ATPase/GTPase